MKKYILFFIIFSLISFTTNAQNEKLQIRVDTSYFPFEDNIQMIQIEYAFTLGNKIKFRNVLSDYNYSYYPIPDSSGLIDKPTTKYIFRNKSGEIISIYNNFDTSQIKKDDFRQPAKVTALDDSIVASLGQLFKFYHLDSIPAKKIGKIGITVYQNQKYKLYGKPTIEYYGKQGLINKNGEIVLKPEHDDIFLGGKSPIIIKNGKIGFLDQKGNPLTPIKFKHLYYSSYGWIKNYNHHVVSVDSLIGIIDPFGNTLFDFDFNYIDIHTRKLNNWFDNKDNNRGQNITEYDNDSFYYVVTKEGKKGFINTRTLTYPIPIDDYDYMNVSRFGDGGCREFLIRKDNKYGYTYKFEKVIPLQYDTVIVKSGGYLVKNGDLYGMYDSNFNMIFPVEYDLIAEKDYGFFYLVKQKGRYGFYSRNFELKLPIEFDTIIRPLYGYIVKKDNLYGFYSEGFNLVIPIIYQDIIVPIYNYDNLYNYELYYFVKKDSLYAIFDKHFKQVTPFEYDEIIKIRSVLKAKKGKYYTLLDSNLKPLCKPIYDEISYDRGPYPYKDYIYFNLRKGKKWKRIKVKLEN